MVPHAAPEQPAPVRLHVTLVFEVPVTVAVNCCWPPARTVAVFGETLTATGGTIVTVAVPDFVGSANDVAEDGEQFDAKIHADYEKWGPVIKA